MKKLLCLLALIIGISQTVHAYIDDPKTRFLTLKTDHFYLHYPEALGSVVEEVAQLSETIFAKMTVKLKWTPWGRTHIVLLDKTDDANGSATVIPANYLVLFITPPDADSTLDHYSRYLEMLITHEFTHILHIDQYHKLAAPPHWIFGKIVAPNGLTPGWMREGFAVLEESLETGRGRANSNYSNMMLRAAIYDNDFPKLDEAQGVGLKWPAGNTAYIFGGKFIKWLSDKYGHEAINRYMEEYSSGLWLFSLNNKARRVFNKSFYKLWKEWQAELKAEFDSVRSTLTAKGLTPMTHLVDSPYQLSYPTALPTEAGYAYTVADLDEPAKIVIQKNKDSIVLKQKPNGQLSFSKDGSLMAFSTYSGVEKYKVYSDIYIYNFSTKKYERLAAQTGKSMRASDPSFSPADGGTRWVVMVRTSLGTDNLYVFDRVKKTGYYLTDAPKYTQFSNPRFSPDGEKIVVSRRDSGGNRDIVLYSKTGNVIENITNDEATDNHPYWSPDGHAIYYSSDLSGIYNIYKHNMGSKQSHMISNVLTGAFQPTVSNDGSTLFLSYYTSKGFTIYSMRLDGRVANVDSAIPPTSIDTSAQISQVENSPFDTASFIQDTTYTGMIWEEPAPAPVNLDDVPQTNEAEKTEAKTPPSAYETALKGKKQVIEEPVVKIAAAKKYSAFPQVLVPRLVIPTFTTLDSGYAIGLSTGGSDPLGRHIWNAYVDYRTDAAFLGGGLVYTYARYNPIFFAGVIRYSLNWGDIFGVGSDFFEDRNQGFVGTSWSPERHHLISATYFYETRDNLSDIPTGFTITPNNLDSYAGFHFKYLYSRYKEYPNSISQENGPFFKAVFDVTNSIFGSAEVNEQQILSGDFRYYLEMPWSNHHVLGLRAAGGFAMGDRQYSGTFRLGGPFGEGTLAATSDRLFALRGLPGVTFAGDRAALFSMEYRLPLATVERGIGTLPVYLKQLHLAFFGDYGDIWYRNGRDNVDIFSQFLLGVGGELRGDFVIGYGLPVTARAGYGIIVVNRDRIAGLTDALVGQELKYGTWYFQFGTSF